MKLKSKILFIFFLWTIFSFFPFFTVSALELEYPSFLGLSITDSSSFIDYARYFFNAGMAIAGLLAVLTIVFGGFYYLISLSKNKFTNEGKQWIKAGIFGLILLVSAYLIAYTINPDLIDFRLQRLFRVGFFGSSGDPEYSGPPRMVYNEIPLGTLTENLLSKTMDCYEFDANGDPIEGEITTDEGETINGPTLLNHDRADCFLKLAEAAEKKAKLFKKLSDKIVELMEMCVCEGKCDTACEADGCVVQGSSCTGDCIKGACKPFKNKSNDCCPSDSGIKKPGTNSNFTVKEIIEYGPIKLDYNKPGKCDYTGKNFRGLDEFRTSLADISNIIEIRPKPVIDDREITVIKNGDCQICDDYNSDCQNSRTSCLENSPWNKLKLIEQLMYFKEKMEEIKSAVEKDSEQLDLARTKIANCYNVKSSVDFLTISEKTEKEAKIIFKNIEFKDAVTGKNIDSSKYCNGFEYAKSDFYSKCQTICPETITTEESKNCYKQCNKNDSACLKNCYNNRPCPTYTPKSAGSNSGTVKFMDCIEGLRKECLNTCKKKYSCSDKDLEKCEESCYGDSTCLLGNEGNCVVSFQNLKICAETNKNPDNLYWRF